MSNINESAEITVKGKKLQCPVCGHEAFHTRKSLLNTRGLTFFNLDWANKDATNYICDDCGYIFWFFNK
ncbi:MAG: hypothetical protein ACFCUM_09100 [Bacteroidales bacterium]